MICCTISALPISRQKNSSLLLHLYGGFIWGPSTGSVITPVGLLICYNNLVKLKIVKHPKSSRMLVTSFSYFQTSSKLRSSESNLDRTLDA